MSVQLVIDMNLSVDWVAELAGPRQGRCGPWRGHQRLGERGYAEPDPAADPARGLGLRASRRLLHTEDAVGHEIPSR